ncbi:MAG TPA: SDR family oxidoreductase [Chloroflexota bacterium]|nr:SDR family oxidoreductase [Chloroflexota bacterium]
MSVLDSLRLEGRVALVSGASHGIGEAIAVAYAQAGADVAIAARSESDLARVAERIRREGRRVAVIPTDVADLAQLGPMVDGAAEQLGEPSILANVAGTTLRKAMLDVTPDEWQRIVDVNLRSVYFASQAFVRRLVARDAGWGKITNIASMTSYRGFDGSSVYGMTKTAVVNLTQMQAVEWVRYGVRANAIAPGWIETPMTAGMAPSRRRWVEEHVPQGHYGAPEDLAGLAVYLASPASDYCTGQTFPVDGGFTAGNPWPPADGQTSHYK